MPARIKPPTSLNVCIIDPPTSGFTSLSPTIENLPLNQKFFVLLKVNINELQLDLLELEHNQYISKNEKDVLSHYNLSCRLLIGGTKILRARSKEFEVLSTQNKTHIKLNLKLNFYLTHDNTLNNQSSIFIVQLVRRKFIPGTDKELNKVLGYKNVATSVLNLSHSSLVANPNVCQEQHVDLIHPEHAKKLIRLEQSRLKKLPENSVSVASKDDNQFVSPLSPSNIQKVFKNKSLSKSRDHTENCNVVGTIGWKVESDFVLVEKVDDTGRKSPFSARKNRRKSVGIDNWTRFLVTLIKNSLFQLFQLARTILKGIIL